MTTPALDGRYCEVRTKTESLAAPLSPEDQTVQSMPDVSPTKWHRAHTTWFFETFVLADTDVGAPYDADFDFLFNSYYESVGPRFDRSHRGLLSRPGAAQVGRYRTDVDERMRTLIDGDLDARRHDLVVLGLHHEQQHQELLLMDAKHVLAQHPNPTPYVTRPEVTASTPSVTHPSIEIAGGVMEIGASGEGFCFDNELPRHRQLLEACSVDGGLVSCAEYLAFIEDGGYERPELWLSEGWAMVLANQWHAPLYWSKHDGTWRRFSLYGVQDVDGHEPVTHVSYFEADAFARWRGCRLPTEAEWEIAATGQDPHVEFAVEPPLVSSGPGFYGSVWQWTQSAYSPYPGFRAAPGAVGEYNGKFMVNQQVLKGGASITPEGHTRASYRNFYAAASRWPYTGIRLARDAT